MRGIIETTRGSAESDTRTQSRVGKRNATEADLAAARKTYIGKPVTLPNHSHACFQCVDVRLDQLHRLIFDLIRQDQHKTPAESEAHDGSTND